MKQAPPTCDCEKCIFKNLMFEGLNLPELEIICKNKEEVKYPKGDMIIRENDTIQSLLYIKSGLVKLFKQNANDPDQIISIAKPYDFIGLLSVFSDQRYNFSVSALEDTVVCIMDLDAVKELVRQNGRFALTLLEKISRTSDNIIKSNLELGKKNLKGRIAYILLYFANNVYEKKSFELPVSRKEIAQWIEMTVENVIRALSEFKRDQIILISGKTIEIIDEQRLIKISELG